MCVLWGMDMHRQKIIEFVDEYGEFNGCAVPLSLVILISELNRLHSKLRVVNDGIVSMHSDDANETLQSVLTDLRSIFEEEGLLASREPNSAMVQLTSQNTVKLMQDQFHEEINTIEATKRCLSTLNTTLLAWLENDFGDAYRTSHFYQQALQEEQPSALKAKVIADRVAGEINRWRR